MATKDYTWNELRKHGVNYDCIITLNKREDGTLERVDHPITYLNSLFDRLERMFNDDEFYDVVNAELYPESSTSIIPICEEVTNLKDEVQKLSAEYELLEKKAERHYRKIEIIQNRYKKSEDKDEAEKKYYNRHPELAELEESMNKLNAELLPQRRHLSMREKFLDSLEGCKSKIESYGILELDFKHKQKT